MAIAVVINPVAATQNRMGKANARRERPRADVRVKRMGGEADSERRAASRSAAGAMLGMMAMAEVRRMSACRMSKPPFVALSAPASGGETLG